MFTSQPGKTAKKTTVWVKRKHKDKARAKKMNRFQKDLSRLINRYGLKRG